MMIFDWIVVLPDPVGRHMIPFEDLRETLIDSFW
jgi:hypothetical protein